MMWCEPLGLVRFHTPAMFIPGSFSMQRIMSLSNLSNASKVSPLSHFSWYSEWFLTIVWYLGWVLVIVLLTPRVADPLENLQSDPKPLNIFHKRLSLASVLEVQHKVSCRICLSPPQKERYRTYLLEIHKK